LRLIVRTQYRENYGAHDWDGKGECPQYWKNKGGVDYEVHLDSPFRAEDIEFLINQVGEKVTRFNDYVEEYVVDWEILGDNEFTKFEQDQLDYEGRIQFPAHKLEV